MDNLNKLISIKEANKLILAGTALVIAGDEQALKQLRRGNWIGGTIPYFMDEEGGLCNTEKVFVTDLGTWPLNFRIATYGESQIEKLPEDAFANGFTYVLVPGLSEVHKRYAIQAEKMPNLFDTPVAGWVTGVGLDDIGRISPKTYNGTTKSQYENHVVAIHVELPKDKVAQLEILNVFEQGQGDTLEFTHEDTHCKTCLVNGQERNLVAYLKEVKADTRFPLVADYAGAKINVSFCAVDEQNGVVQFYTPLRAHVQYKLAKPLADYVGTFEEKLPSADSPLIACNCILNYVHSELEEKKTGAIRYPFSFGEIAYVLLNQTMVYLTIV